MCPNKNEVQFKTPINEEDYKKQNKYNEESLKKLLIEKYGLTEKDANEKIILIEKRILKNQTHPKNPKNISRRHDDTIPKKETTDSIYKINFDENDFHKKSVYKSKKNINLNNNQPEFKSNNTNVDTILTDIIPDYNKTSSIELKNVNLTFEIEKDKIDNLKEKIIRTLKRNKSKKTKLEVLKNISFKINQGEKVGIIGYNGAGKSTLLNVICGIYVPDSGIVKTTGKISPLLSLGAGFDHNYSGAKNIFLNGAVLGYSKSFLKEKFDEIVEFSELGEFIEYPIKNYSSGMLAKLGFSIATAVEPDILIIDEVLVVGDVTFQKKSSDKIKSLMEGKTTVLLVSHSIPQIRELCDKAIWIDQGRVREIGEVNIVCDHYLEDAKNATKNQLKNIQMK